MPNVEFGSIEVTEIIGVAKEGSLRPVSCRCSDGEIYYVKPLNCGSWPLCLEWICARAARSLGISVPNYRQVYLAPELVEEWNLTGQKVFLDPGIGFGSQRVNFAEEVRDSHIKKLDPTIPEKIVWFDWWIRNTDRIKKNPNLIWSSTEECLYVIDNEKSGDTGNGANFKNLHFFGSHFKEKPVQLFNEMRATLGVVHEAKSELPLEWTNSVTGLDWFISHLESSLESLTTDRWITHNE